MRILRSLLALLTAQPAQYVSRETLHRLRREALPELPIARRRPLAAPTTSSARPYSTAVNL